MLAQTTVKTHVLNVTHDARGFAFEPMTADGLSQFRNVHIVWTLPGNVRGNHYHIRGTEVCSTIGPTLVRYREAGQIHDVHVPAGEIWQFTFPAGVSHALRVEGTEAALMAVFNTEASDPQHPDTVRDVLIPATPPISPTKIFP